MLSTTCFLFVVIKTNTTIGHKTDAKAGISKYIHFQTLNLIFRAFFLTLKNSNPTQIPPLLSAANQVPSLSHYFEILVQSPKCGSTPVTNMVKMNRLQVSFTMKTTMVRLLLELVLHKLLFTMEQEQILLPLFCDLIYFVKI